MSRAADRVDRLLVNGRIHTMDPDNPVVDAVAISGNRIRAAGPSREIRPLAGPETDIIDVAGCTVSPGLIDTHFHFFEWALKRQQLDLAAAASLDDMARRTEAFARTLAADQWLIGYGWNEVDWPEHRMPDRRLLDRLAADRPVILWRCDFHLAAANSRALALAGIDRNCPDPENGLIEKDASGEPTGILRELAINRVREVIPETSESRCLDHFKDGILALHRLGLTGIHDLRLMNDADGARAFRLWQTLRGRNDLAIRCWVTLPGERMDEAISLGLRTGLGDDFLRVGHLKFFADGGMGARTAWMVEPYRDGGSGLPITPPEELAEAVSRADAAGLSVMIHAVGDRATREVIRIYRGQLQQRRSGDHPLGAALPHRIEHVQTIHPDDIGRLPGMDIAMSVTPPNMVLDINTVDDAIGERGRWAYAFRDLIDTGVPVMFSSDCPVCSPDPLEGIRSAVLRTRRDGTPEGGWHPRCRVTLEEALRAYTAVPAAAQGQGDRLGKITSGYLADLAVFDRDLFAGSPEALAEARVTMTVFDGKVVFRD